MSLVNDILKELKNSDLTLADIFKAIEYLKYYGYLLKEDKFTIQDFFTAIAQFREFFHIDSDEALDRMTIKAMLSTPRCGHPDVLASRVEEAKWRKKSLTYFIKQNVSKLNGARNDELDCLEIAAAFASWSEIADLKFSRTNKQSGADIVFSIGRGRGDGFDGPSGTLAYAYLPNGSDSQLGNVTDDDETWITLSNLRGTYRRNVLAHEIGHNLGLEHSKKSGDLMAPYYAPGVSKPQAGDISRIVSMYGKATTPVPPPVDPTDPTVPGVKKTVNITFYDGDVWDIPGYTIVKSPGR
jgi:hypothetical protein